MGTGSFKPGIGQIAELIQQIDPNSGLIGSVSLFHGAGQTEAELIGDPTFNPPATGIAVNIARGGRILILHNQDGFRVAQSPVGHNPAARRTLQRLRQGYDPLDIIELVIPPCG